MKQFLTYLIFFIDLIYPIHTEAASFFKSDKQTFMQSYYAGFSNEFSLPQHLKDPGIKLLLYKIYFDKSEAVVRKNIIQLKTVLGDMAKPAIKQVQLKNLEDMIRFEYRRLGKKRQKYHIDRILNNEKTLKKQALKRYHEIYLCEIGFY